MEVVKVLTPKEEAEKQKVDRLVKKYKSFVEKFESSSEQDRQAILKHIELLNAQLDLLDVQNAQKLVDQAFPQYSSKKTGSQN